MHRRLLTLAWSSSQAGGTLAIGSTAWLLSGLTPSPLVNGVLPALATMPLLLPLPRRIRLGYLVQLLSLVLLLTAYGLGRTGAEAWGPRLPARLPYLLMAAVLVATQFVSGWGAVLLFVPFGLLAALSDARLAAGVDPDGDLQRNWNRLERSSALGGLLGSLGMGLIAQVIGLAGSLPIQLVGFLGAGALLPVLQRPRR
jgi:hypothetical protein